MKKKSNGMILLAITILSAARQFAGKLLGEGEHKVTITSIAESLSKPSSAWKDQTPQIEVQFKDAMGHMITHWFNQKGYQQKKDFENGVAPKGIEFRSSENGNEEYAVDTKTGLRLVSESRTADCLRILGEFANDCGIPTGEEGSVEGKEVGVGVRKNARDNYEVYYTKPASKVKLAESAEA